jgi:hypothetical protein
MDLYQLSGAFSQWPYTSITCSSWLTQGMKLKRRTKGDGWNLDKDYSGQSDTDVNEERLVPTENH